MEEIKNNKKLMFQQENLIICESSHFVYITSSSI